MVKEIRHTSIMRVLDNILEHPMLTDVTLEQAVRYTLRFIEKHGYYRFYEEKTAEIEIHDFRGMLPCDLISIIQVKDDETGICLRGMTDSFGGKRKVEGGKDCVDPMNNVKKPWYIYRGKKYFEEPSFKTQGRVIYTSFPEGRVIMAYQAIPVDEDGFPLLIDNENYLDALEAYIKMRVFTIKHDQGKINASVLQHAKQDYAVAARLLQSEFTLPSVSEMQSMANMWSTLIPKMRDFDNGFKNSGDREWLKRS